MSLDFSTADCKDRTFIDDVTEDGTEVWHPAVQSMAFASMSVGIGHVTETTWGLFYERYTEWNVALGYTTDWYLTPEIVKSFIGFKTNAGRITQSAWKLKVYEAVANHARNLERNRAKRNLERNRAKRYMVRFTADHFTEESTAEGMPAESGWVNPKWSREEIHATPDGLTKYSFDTRDEAVEFITEQIGEVHTTNGETYYTEDPHTRLDTSDHWMLAGHITDTREA